MISFILSCVLGILIIISGALIKVWAGFIYFALSFALLLSIYWSIILIYRFIYNYYKDFEDDFNTYVAKLFNTTDLTREQFEKTKPYYIKKFKKSRKPQKLHDLVFIIVALGILTTVVMAFFLI